MIQGDKIYLRGVEPSDLQTLLNWENKTKYWHLSNTLIPFTQHTLQVYVNAHHDLIKEQQYRYMICLPENHQSVGMLDLFDYDPIHLRAGIGIMIASEEDRGRGYAKEAIQLIKKHVKQVLFLNQLFANVLEENYASIKLFKSCRFEIMGKKEKWHKTSEGWQAEYFFQCML